MMSQICRWGFVSAANIARKNWLAVKNSGNGQVVAVASRQPEKALAFINECQSTQPFSEPPVAVAGYDDLLNRSDIDAVYIPLPTALRKEWVIRAAEKGKHVLCEKPCSSNAADLREMIDACEANGVQFMDGLMFEHTARYREMRSVLDTNESIGSIRRITSQFSFNGGQDFEDSDIRLNSDLEPFGALGDLGWYSIRHALWAMSYEMPSHVKATFLQTRQRSDSPNPIPMEMSCEMFFADGVSASFYNSFVTGLQQWACVSGTKGQLSQSDFVLPYHGEQSRYQISTPASQNLGCEFKLFENREDRVVQGVSDSGVDAPETELFRRFASIVDCGQLDPAWPTASLKTQMIMDAAMRSGQGNGQMVAVDSIDM